MDKIYRANGGKVLAGICAGIAKSMNVEPNLVRFLFIIVAVLTKIWVMLLVYALLWVIMPKADDDADLENVPKQTVVIYIAAALIGIGFLMLLNTFIPINIYRYTLPIGLIIGGGVLLVFTIRNNKQ